MAAGADDKLAKEFHWYLDNQQEMVEKYNGRYIAIKGKEVLGSYDSEEAAITESWQRHEPGTVLIQHVSPGTGSYTTIVRSPMMIEKGERMRDVDAPAPKQSPRPTAPTRPMDEIARLGDEIYERDIRRQVEADHHGEYVAIDVDSGSWAVSDDLRAAAKRLRAQCPEAIDVWLLRVGYRALHHFGGRPLRRAE